jgi:hypothetical protein
LSIWSFFDENAEHRDMVHVVHLLTQAGGMCALVSDRSKLPLNSLEKLSHGSSRLLSTMIDHFCRERLRIPAFKGERVCHG